jgi:hypothetical protein
MAFTCAAINGGIYYCKQDTDGRPVRLTDWFCTKLAAHLGIATAECVVIEDSDFETYFGSQAHASTRDDYLLRKFLVTPQVDESGRPSSWLGQYLSGLLTLDLFLANDDRDYPNFVLRQDGLRLVLCAIDFGSARLDKISTQDFAVASTRTIFVGKHLLRLHGRAEASAIEMVERIAATPTGTVESFFNGIPETWSNAAQKEGICDAWGGSLFFARLEALRAVIKDGTLL